MTTIFPGAERADKLFVRTRQASRRAVRLGERSEREFGDGFKPKPN